MSALQPFILPILATAGAIYLGKKLYEVTHSYHTVFDTYQSVSTRAELQVPTSFPNYLKTRSGLILHTRRYLVPADQCKGIVFFCHGFTEHSGRYEGLAYDFNKLGYSVCMIDHQGHGASQGDRSYVSSFQSFIEHVIEWMNNEHYNIINSLAGWGIPGFSLNHHQQELIFKNVIISAHSMGGLISTKLAIHLKQYPECLPWLYSSSISPSSSPTSSATSPQPTPTPTSPRFILSAPALALDKSLTDLPLLLKISNILSYLFPKLIVQKMPDVELSTDLVITQIAKRDPLINGPHVFARFGSEFINTIQYCHDNAKIIDFPFLIMQSNQDNIIDCEGGKEFIKKISTPNENKKYITCRGYHEILFDVDRDMLIECIKDFLQQHQVNE